MANPDNPYTMGGFLRSRMQQKEEVLQQQPIVPPRGPLPPVQQTVDASDQPSNEPSALDLIGESIVTFAKLVPHIPTSIAAKSKGKPLPPSVTGVFENIDGKLNRGNPNSPLVKGLKKYWNTPEPKPEPKPNATTNKPLSDNTQRPMPSVGVETPEERMARQTSQQRGDFDATPPVEETVLRRNRSYSQVGYNTLSVPEPVLPPQPQIRQPEQQATPQPRRFTNDDAKYLAAQGLYLGIDPITGEFIRKDKPTDHTRSRPLNQQEIQYIYDALGPVDLRPRKTKQNRNQPQPVPEVQTARVEQMPPRSLTREDLDALEQQGITLIPDRGVIYVDPMGKRRIRKITAEEHAWVIDYLGNVDLGSIMETQSSNQQQQAENQPKPQELTVQKPKPAKPYNKISIVTSVQGKK